MGDLFWDIATSYLALAIDGVVLIAALVVGYFPLLKYLPAIGPYVPAAKLVSFLMAGLMCFLIGFRVSDDRAEAKTLRSEIAARTIDLNAAQDAARQADEARAQLAEQTKQDQERIADYEKALKARPDAACALNDDDLRWLHDGKPGR